MRLIKILYQKKIVFINTFIFLYILINLIFGERGLISYYEKNKLKEELILKEKSLLTKLEKKNLMNDLLTKEIDLDYIEILYRKKFMVGKSNEKIYTISLNDKI